MNEQDLLDKLTQIVRRNAPRTRTIALTLDTNLEYLGIDSAHRIDILLDTEDTFQVSIEDGIFAKVHTLGDLAEMVKSLSFVAQ